MEKRAARTVVFDRSNGKIKTAIISVRNGEYFKIPGGGIEEGETEEQAAIREAREETGCNVKIVHKIGESSFTDDKGDIHHSVCFLAEKESDGSPSFDEWEKSNNFKLSWVDLDEAERLFMSANTKDPFGIEINQRDHEFIKDSKSLNYF